MRLVGRSLALLVVAAALLVGLAVIAPMVGPRTTEDADPGAVTASDPAVSPADDGFLDIPADAVPMTVTSLVDGDTLSAADADGRELRIRVIGIDTPETYPETECYGPEAAAELARLAPIGATVLVTQDVEPEDAYGRALRYLWDADGQIGLRLVANGFAEAIRVGANDAYWPELQAAEQDARDAGRGMWGAC